MTAMKIERDRRGLDQRLAVGPLDPLELGPAGGEEADDPAALALRPAPPWALGGARTPWRAACARAPRLAGARGESLSAGSASSDGAARARRRRRLGLRRPASASGSGSGACLSCSRSTPRSASSASATSAGLGDLGVVLGARLLGALGVDALALQLRLAPALLGLALCTRLRHV